ncbi:TIGR01777 family oxidoreductase [Parasalinivibrio latis]|uniref:TIGR01777 family oxidoreductase n=1 Tax=Parasalinivibrio latis TaxID=2952610 RepID=UPI0030E1AE13
MNILITGGTGLIGRALIRELKGHQLSVLTRDEIRAGNLLGNGINFMSSLGTIANLNDYDAVINLAGEPIVDKRWTDKQKSVICHSRWDITEKLSELVQASSSPPEIFISGSAVGIYGDQKDEEIAESFRVESDEFAHEVCQKWEEIALTAQSEKTRVCLLRTGIVLSAKGGAVRKMLVPYRLGLGGPIGRGLQYMPWIHIDDMVSAIIFLLNNKKAFGPYNLTAPYPVTNREFSAALARTLNRPHILFTPEFAIKLLLGESAQLLLDSTRAVPKALLDAGFSFKHTKIDEAMQHLF